MKLNFFDFSTRSPSDLTTYNLGAITWTANLYPVLWNQNDNTLTIENGIQWGWTIKNAAEGSISGIFVDPTPGATVSGVGTNIFSTGDGDPSVIEFDGDNFNTSTDPNNPSQTVKFLIGHLTFTNGANTNRGE